MSGRKNNNTLETAFLLIGSNLNNPVNQLKRAIIALQRHGEVTVSGFYESQPWGLLNQPNFVNVAVMVQWLDSPESLLETTRKIELDLGRKNEVKWGPRVIDIDILFFGEETINTPQLQVPHPRVAERRFVLVPMAELAPRLIHPTLGKSMEQLLEQCADPSWVRALPL